MIYKPSTFNIVVAFMSILFGSLLYLSLEQSDIFSMSDDIWCFTFISGGILVIYAETKMFRFSHQKYSSVLYTSFIGLFLILSGNIITVLRNLEYGFMIHNYIYLTRSSAFMLLCLYLAKTISDIYTSLIYYREAV
jgi:hypothetical protein